VYAVSFSQNGLRLASSGCFDRTVQIWNARNGRGVNTLQWGLRALTALAFFPRGTQLAIGTGDGEVILVNGRRIRMLKNREEYWPVRSVASSPDGERLASGSEWGTISLWDAKGGHLLWSVKAHDDHVNGLAFSPDGARLASASMDRKVKLWEVSSGHPVHTLEGHAEPVNAVMFSPDGVRLASASGDGTVKLWDPQNGLVVATLLALPADQWIAFLPDGTYDGPEGVEERITMAFEYADEDIKLRLEAIGTRRDPVRVRCALSGEWAGDTKRSPAPPSTSVALPHQLPRGGRK